MILHITRDILCPHAQVCERFTEFHYSILQKDLLLNTTDYWYIRLSSSDDELMK